jgi:hypothetical protein
MPAPRLAAIGVGFQMHLFILDRAPQPFDENVVHETAASVHRNRDAGRRELACESLGGESGALIGVEDPRLSEAKHRLLQRRGAELASLVFDNRHARTARLAQSMIATRRSAAARRARATAKSVAPARANARAPG